MKTGDIMKVYAVSIKYLFSISLVTILLLFLCHDYRTIYDISLAIFGSSVVSLIISIIGYNYEKKKTLELFYKSVYKRIVYYGTYLQSWSLEDKCTYYINHYLKDFPSIGDAYDSIYFLCDKNDKNKKYIYNEIYIKCKNMIDTIDSYYLDFATYLNKTGVKTIVAENFIKELEGKLFKYEESTVKSDFSDKIMKELNGKYYKIMYGHECDKNEKKE